MDEKLDDCMDLEKRVSQSADPDSASLPTGNEKIFDDRLDEQDNDDDYDSEVPINPGFFCNVRFLKVILLVALSSTLTALATSAFMNFTEEILKKWTDFEYNLGDLQNDEGEFKNNGVGNIDYNKLYGGNKYWVLVTTSFGLLVGLLRWLFVYPHNLPGLLSELKSLELDCKWIPLTYLISGLSLAGGASLGPERAMGNLGGGLASLISKNIDFGQPIETAQYRKLIVLAGITSGVGSLLSNPLLAVLMVLELVMASGSNSATSNNAFVEFPRPYMETLVVLSIAASISFVVYYQFLGITYLDIPSSYSIQLSLNWLNVSGYDSSQIGVGLVIGLIGAGLCFVTLISISLSKRVFATIGKSLEGYSLLQEVVPPMIGGLVTGTDR